MAVVCTSKTWDRKWMDHGRCLPLSGQEQFDCLLFLVYLFVGWLVRLLVGWLVCLVDDNLCDKMAALGGFVLL